MKPLDPFKSTRPTVIISLYVNKFLRRYENIGNSILINISSERFRKVGSNTVYQLIGKAITACLTFLGLALIARHYGPTGIGEYTLVLTYIALLYLFADAGFNAVSVRSIVSHPENTSEIFDRLLGTRLIWSIGLSVVSIGLAILLPYSGMFRFGAVVLSLILPAQAVIVSANAVFQSRLEYRFSVLVTGLNAALTFCVVATATYLNLGLRWLYPGTFIGVAGGAIFSLYLVRRRGIGIKPVMRYSALVRLVRRTLPLTLTLILNVVAFKIDVFLLAYFAPISEVGIYNLAYRVFENVITIPTFVVNAIYPYLIVDKNSGREVLRSITRRSLTFFAAGGIGLMSILVLVAPWVIKLLGGASFSGSVTILRLLSMGLPLFFVSALLMWLVITLERSWTLVKIYGVGLLLNTTLNMLFIPHYGATAAAINTVITELVILVWLGYVVYREISSGD